jgi:glycosyltransferase involved in cell wall biosynthesis
MSEAKPLFSVITPTAGKRPRALAQAVDSVADALDVHACGLEMLIGLDGCPREQALAAAHPLPDFVRVFEFPAWGEFGNRARHALIRQGRGEYLLFLDDDNAFTPEALAVFAARAPAEFIAARIDTSRAFDKPLLPELEPGRDPVRQCNIDPLCLCLSRELVLHRCGGWQAGGGYESDFLNIRRFHRRARSAAFAMDVAGVYDAGRGLDPDGMNSRQAAGAIPHPS